MKKGVYQPKPTAERDNRSDIKTVFVDHTLSIYFLFSRPRCFNICPTPRHVLVESEPLYLSYELPSPKEIYLIVTCKRTELFHSFLVVTSFKFFCMKLVKNKKTRQNNTTQNQKTINNNKTYLNKRYTRPHSVLTNVVLCLLFATPCVRHSYLKIQSS